MVWPLRPCDLSLPKKNVDTVKVLVINPGSTSTKVAAFDDERVVCSLDVAHSMDQLAAFEDVLDQYEFRETVVLDALRKQGIPLAFDAVIGRGGLSRPVESGVYEVNDVMLSEVRQAKHKHACDLGCIIAHDIAARMEGCRSFIADPGCVDEMADEAHFSGSPLMPRICIWHALNQKAIGRRFARERGTEYERLNLIMCHLGGGISIAAHQNGRAIDANNALDGEGPFSPERAGSLPAADLIRLCFSGQLSEAELLRRVAGKAGLVAHLGTNDMREVERRIADGDDYARRVVDAMVWHTAKAICAEGAVLNGQVDAILLMGGLAHSDYIVSRLKQRIAWLAPVHVYPGQDEMLALAQNALAVLRGERTASCFAPL